MDVARVCVARRIAANRPSETRRNSEALPPPPFPADTGEVPELEEDEELELLDEDELEEEEELLELEDEELEDELSVATLMAVVLAETLPAAS